MWNSAGTALENSTVSVNALESTLNGYKTTAESAATTATTQAGISTTQAGIATTQAGIATQKATEASTTLSSKATTDLDNITSSGKNKIENLLLPDYSQKTSISASDFPYTALSNGYIHFVGSVSGETSFSVFVNTNRVSLLYVGGSAVKNYGITFPVSTGDVISFSGTSILSDCVLFPMKGV